MLLKRAAPTDLRSGVSSQGRGAPPAPGCAGTGTFRYRQNADTHSRSSLKRLLKWEGGAAERQYRKWLARELPIQEVNLLTPSRISECNTSRGRRRMQRAAAGGNGHLRKVQPGREEALAHHSQPAGRPSPGRRPLDRVLHLGQYGLLPPGRRTQPEDGREPEVCPERRLGHFGTVKMLTPPLLYY